MAEEQEKCSVCNEAIIVGETAFDENTCGLHYAHTRCIRTKNEGSFECNICNAPISYPSLDELRSDAKGEDDDDDDSVHEEDVEIGLPTVSIFGGMKKMTSGWFKDKVETSTNPFFLLSQKYPVSDFISTKRMGLVELVNNNSVSLQDFLSNGYTLVDLCGFPQIASEAGGLPTLIGMGLTHSHLVEYKEQMPPSQMYEFYGLTPDVIIDELKYDFESPSRGGWLIEDYLDYHFKMDDLLEAGLTYQWEWQDLIKDASSEQIKALGVKEEHIDGLKKIKKHRQPRYVEARPQVVFVESDEPRGRTEEKRRHKEVRRQRRSPPGYVIGSATSNASTEKRVSTPHPGKEVGVVIVESAPRSPQRSKNKKKSPQRRRGDRPVDSSKYNLVEPEGLFKKSSSKGGSGVRPRLRERK